MSEEKKKTPKTISRREFLKDAGIVVGGTAVGSAFFLSACGKEVEVTKTVTTTAPGTTSTVTTTVGGSTQTVTKYTCPVCSQEFNSLDALKTHFDEAHEEQAAAENVINITVNGQEYEIQVEPKETLRDTLRDQLGLTSIKDMCCGWGACGSCTVISNGRPILSCMVLTIECDGKSIETAEGIANNEHPLIDAFVMNDAMQCGYCTPGFICTAKALLDKRPNPTEDDIRNALGGNICRCAIYPQLIPSVKEAVAEIQKGGNS